MPTEQTARVPNLAETCTLALVTRVDGWRRHLAGCREGVSPSARRARTPAGQPPDSRRTAAGTAALLGASRYGKRCGGRHGYNLCGEVNRGEIESLLCSSLTDESVFSFSDFVLAAGTAGAAVARGVVGAREWYRARVARGRA